MTSIAVKRILGVLLVFLIISIFFGVLKIELILHFVNVRGLRLMRLISDLSLFVSAILAIIVIGILITAGYFSLVLVKNDVTLGPYSESVVWLVWMYALNEISKTFILYLTLPKYLVIRSSVELMRFISNPKYLSITFYSDVFFIVSGLIIYAFVLKKKEIGITWLQIIISSATLSLNLIFSHFL